MAMPDTVTIPAPQDSVLVRAGKEESLGRQRGMNTSTEFPEYLKHMDTLGNNGKHAKVTASNTLFQAVLKGRVRSTEYLLDRGTAVNGRNDYGFSVLTAALHINNRKRRGKMFHMLLEHGADPHFKDSNYERSVLHWACVLGRTEQVEMLLNEVAADLDLRQKDRGSHTALHHAVMAGHLPVVVLLVDIHNKFGVSVDLADNMGLTPYLHAKRLGYRDVAGYLHNEGQASQGHADTLFRTPREWSMIGKFERQKALQNHTLEAINNAKIQGKIRRLQSLENSMTSTSASADMAVSSPVFPSFAPPRQRRSRHLAVPHADRLSTSLPSLQEDERFNGKRRPTSTNGVTIPRQDGTDFVDDGHIQNHTDSGAVTIPRPPMEAFVQEAIPPMIKDTSLRPHHHLLPVSKWDGTDGIPTRGDPHEYGGGLLLPVNKSPKSTAAFTLIEMNKKGRHASTYRQSQFDETKAMEYQHILGNLNSIMDMLSQQQSRSFRQSVKYQRPETPKKPKTKTKVSSLAVIFGRDKSGRRSKRRSARGSRKKEPDAPSKKKKEKGVSGEKKTKAPEKKKALPLLKVNDKIV